MTIFLALLACIDIFIIGLCVGIAVEQEHSRKKIEKANSKIAKLSKKNGELSLELSLEKTKNIRKDESDED